MWNLYDLAIRPEQLVKLSKMRLGTAGAKPTTSNQVFFLLENVSRLNVRARSCSQQSRRDISPV